MCCRSWTPSPLVRGASACTLCPAKCGQKERHSCLLLGEWPHSGVHYKLRGKRLPAGLMPSLLEDLAAVEVEYECKWLRSGRLGWSCR